MPEIQSFESESAIKLFEALADTDDMKIFETQAMMKLIQFKWPLIFEYTLKLLFFPFVCFLIWYCVYVSFTTFIYISENRQWYTYVLEFLLILNGLYLLGNEVY